MPKDNPDAYKNEGTKVDQKFHSENRKDNKGKKQRVGSEKIDRAESAAAIKNQRKRQMKALGL